MIYDISQLIVLIAAIIVLVSACVSYCSINETKRIRMLYMDSKIMSDLKLQASVGKLDRCNRVADMLGQLLIDLAYSTNNDELNWKLYHIRSLSDALKTKLYLTDDGLYQSIMKMVNTSELKDQKAWLAIIKKEMSTYYGMSEIESVEIGAVLEVVSHLAHTSGNTDAKIESAISSIRDAVKKLRLSFAMIDEKVEEERKNYETRHTAKGKSFETVLDAERYMNDIVIEEVPEGETETGETEGGQGSTDEVYRDEQPPVHGEEDRADQPGDPETHQDVIVVTEDDPRG